MRNLILKNNEINTGSNSLPVIIRLLQHDDNNFEAVKDVRNRVSGSIGNGFMDFTMDFTCAPIKLGSDADPFSEINNILLNKKHPTFSGEYFKKNYYIIEIPDYSHQSMSYGYRDFVPHIYIEGKKLWQKYVGLIKQYSKRTAWIVIAKKNNITKDLSDDDAKTLFENSNNFIIRIMAKNNIENKFGNEDQDSTPVTRNGDFTYVASSSFTFQNRNLTDYDFYNKNNETVANLDAFSNLNIGIPNYTLTSQNILDDSNKPFEYFRQSFINDYTSSETNKAEVYYRPDSESSMTLTLDYYNNHSQFILFSKQNNYNVLYVKGSDFKNLSNIFSNFSNIRNYSDITVYNSDGERLIDWTVLINDDSPFDDTTFEIVPEYDSRRKLDWSYVLFDNKDSANVNKILYDNYIFPYNLIDCETMCFEHTSDNLAKYIGSIDDITEVGSGDTKYKFYISIYDSGVVEDINMNVLAGENLYEIADSNILYNNKIFEFSKKINTSNPYSFSLDKLDDNFSVSRRSKEPDTLNINSDIFFIDADMSDHKMRFYSNDSVKELAAFNRSGNLIIEENNITEDDLNVIINNTNDVDTKYRNLIALKDSRINTKKVIDSADENTALALFSKVFTDMFTNGYVNYVKVSANNNKYNITNGVYCIETDTEYDSEKLLITYVDNSDDRIIGNEVIMGKESNGRRLFTLYNEDENNGSRYMMIPNGIPGVNVFRLEYKEVTNANE